MNIRKNSISSRGVIARFGAVILAGAMLAISGPALAGNHSHHVSRSIVIKGDGDLLQKLIDLDAGGIEEMRQDLADARADILDAISDVRDAREDAKDGAGAAIVDIAMKAARASLSGVVEESLAEAGEEVDRAERDLRTADVSPEERAETQHAIDVLREGLAGIEDALTQLADSFDD